MTGVQTCALPILELGVSDNVCFINAFVEKMMLLDYLAAADIYVTPYLNAAQITSGTLSYAIGVGRPVVSTPYWHAVQLTADDHGRLVPYGSSEGFDRNGVGEGQSVSYRVE